MRPIEDWADLKYRQTGHIAHIVPFGDFDALCRMNGTETEWYGTGDFDEIETAQQLPLCTFCKAAAVPTSPTGDPSVEAWSQAYRTNGLAEI